MFLASLVVLLILACAVAFFAADTLVAFFVTKVPFVTSDFADIKFFIKKIGISNKDTFYDLGSGNGKVVFTVEKLTGAKVKGFEFSFSNIIFSRVKVLLVGSKAEFIREDFFTQDWSKANVIYCYLFPPLMGRIEQKFKAEMRPGSIAVVRDFPFPNMTAVEKYNLPKNHKIYIYKNNEK